MAAPVTPSGSSTGTAATSTTASTATADAAPAEDVDTTRAASRQWYGFALLCVVATAVISYLAGFHIQTPALKVETGTFTAVAALWVATQAVERFAELTLAPLRLKRSAWAFGAAKSPAYRANRTLFIGGVSTVAGALLSAFFGIYFVSMLSAAPGDGAAPPRVPVTTVTTGSGVIGEAPAPTSSGAGSTSDEPGSKDKTALALDVFVTALAIGGGTKALHSLLDRIEAKPADSGSGGSGSAGGGGAGGGGATGGAASGGSAAPQAQSAAQGPGPAPGRPGA
jgi:uncharacterized membrane protein YgcG